MKKVGLHIKDGKITTDDGKELLLVYVDALERLQEQLNEANEALKKAKEKALSVELSGFDYDNRHKMYDIMFTDGIIDSYLDKWGVK